MSIRIARAPGLAMLPQITAQVLKLADESGTSLKQLAALIKRDPALSAHLLRVANSAFYGMGGKVQTLSHAICLLGVNAVRSVAVSQAYQQILTHRGQATRFNKVAFWQHSLASGVATRILARLKGLRDAEEAFVAGLIHDAGRLIFDRFLPQEFDQAILYSMERACSLRHAEQEIIGYTHTEAGDLLAKQWNLPDSLRLAIAAHHEPTAFEEHPLVCLTYAANVLAHQCGFALGSPVNYQLDSIVQESLGLHNEQYDSIRQVIVDELRQNQLALNI